MEQELEIACIEFLKRLRFPKGILCKKCKKITRHSRNSRRAALYSCHQCRTQTSIRANTPFSNSKIPLTKWMQVLILLERHGTLLSGWKIAKKININYKSAWRMKNHLIPLLSDPLWQSFLKKVSEGKREENWESYKNEQLKTRRINGRINAKKQWEKYHKEGKWPRMVKKESLTR